MYPDGSGANKLTTMQLIVFCGRHPYTDGGGELFKSEAWYVDRLLKEIGGDILGTKYDLWN